MDDFCHFQKNVFLPTREGIAKAKEVIKKLGLSNESHESFLISLEHILGLLVAKVKEKSAEARSTKRLAGLVNEEFQTDLETGRKSTLDPRERPRETTESPEDPGTKRLKETRPKASKRGEDWVEVPGRKKPRKKRTLKP